MYRSSSAVKVSFSAEYRLRKANGQYAWIQHDSIPKFGADGRFQHYLNLLINATHIQRLHQDIADQQVALDAMNDSVVKLRDICCVTHTHQTVPLMLDFVVEQTVQLVRGQAGILYRIVPETGWLVPYASTGLPLALLQDFCIGPGISCSGQAIAQRRLSMASGLEIEAFEALGSRCPELRPLIEQAQQRIAHTIAVPIELHGRAIAVLAVYQQDQPPCNVLYQNMLQSIAAQVSLALSAVLAPQSCLPNNQPLV